VVWEFNPIAVYHPEADNALGAKGTNPVYLHGKRGTFLALRNGAGLHRPPTYQYGFESG